jgi:hypothetical protein
VDISTGSWSTRPRGRCQNLLTRPPLAQNAGGGCRASPRNVRYYGRAFLEDGHHHARAGGRRTRVPAAIAAAWRSDAEGRRAAPPERRPTHISSARPNGYEARENPPALSWCPRGLGIQRTGLRLHRPAPFSRSRVAALARRPAGRRVIPRLRRNPPRRSVDVLAPRPGDTGVKALRRPEARAVPVVT